LEAVYKTDWELQAVYVTANGTMEDVVEIVLLEGTEGSGAMLTMVLAVMPKQFKTTSKMSHSSHTYLAKYLVEAAEYHIACGVEEGGVVETADGAGGDLAVFQSTKDMVASHQPALLRQEKE